VSAFTVTGGLNGACRLVVQPAPEGVYLFVFQTEGSVAPELDYLQDSLEEAFAQAMEDFGAPASGWTVWKGPVLA